MLTRLDGWVRRWSADQAVWTNVYGLARTLLASASALNLLANDTSALFSGAAGHHERLPHAGVPALGLFSLFGEAHLELARWLAVAALALVASGWRPRVTGLLHWWVAFSFQANATLVEGGDQIAAVLALLLVPVTLTDRRLWHWDPELPAPTAEPTRAKVVALVAYTMVRIQVAGIYFHAAAGKFGAEEWGNGTALYYWLSHPTFGAPTWLEPWLRPVLTSAWVAPLTWSVVLLEFSLVFGLVVSKPVRRWLLVGGIALHLGIMVVHGLVGFAMIMIGALVLFLRPLEQPFRLPRFGPMAAPSASSDDLRLKAT